MRNQFRILILVAALSTVPFGAEAAKPAYCLQALKNCASSCREFIEPFSSACIAGCSIGYLSCGG